MKHLAKMYHQAIIAILRHIGRIKSIYPNKLRNKTRADFVERIHKQNKNSDK